MEKIFYPNVEYNAKQRKKFFIFYVLMFVCLGGLAIILFSTSGGTNMLSMLILFFMIMVVVLAIQTFKNYPTKRLPLLTVEGKSVIFGANDTVKISEIVSVSVLIDVPRVSKIQSENEAFLKKVSEKKPEEPMLGACDVTVRNPKNGKEIIKYAIVEDCIGCLDALLSIGVKKYRILYSMKKLSEEAKYKMGNYLSEEAQQLSEREKMEQLI